MSELLLSRTDKFDTAARNLVDLLRTYAHATVWRRVDPLDQVAVGREVIGLWYQ